MRATSFLCNSKSRHSRALPTATERARLTYRLVNRVLLLSIVLGVGAILAVHWCEGDTCWMRKLYGKDCILCGCTRDFLDILSGNAPSRNDASCLLFGLSAVELAWRTFFSFRLVRSVRVMIADAALHVPELLLLTFWNLKSLFGSF